MSQHCFKTERAGSPVSVLLGFDRPLGNFYLVVQDLAVRQRQDALQRSQVTAPNDGDEEEEDGVLYSNLNEPDAFELSLDHYREVLARLDIQVPETMFEQVELDAIRRVGNRVVTYEASGVFVEC